MELSNYMRANASPAANEASNILQIACVSVLLVVSLIKSLDHRREVVNGIVRRSVTTCQSIHIYTSI